MGGKERKSGIDQEYDSLKSQGNVTGLVAILRAKYPDLRPDGNGIINVEGLRDTWRVGVKLSDGTHIGRCLSFSPIKNIIRFAVDSSTGSTEQFLDPNQEIRWEKVEDKSIRFTLSTDSDLD